jgi:hypothetical protein
VALASSLRGVDEARVVPEAHWFIIRELRQFIKVTSIRRHPLATSLDHYLRRARCNDSITEDRLRTSVEIGPRVIPLDVPRRAARMAWREHREVIVFPGEENRTLKGR